MGKAKSSYYYKSCLQICLALPLPASLKLNQHWLGTLGNLSNGICSSQSLSMMSMNRTPRLYSSTPRPPSMIAAFRSRQLRNWEVRARGEERRPPLTEVRLFQGARELLDDTALVVEAQTVITKSVALGWNVGDVSAKPTTRKRH